MLIHSTQQMYCEIISGVCHRMPSVIFQEIANFLSLNFRLESFWEVNDVVLTFYIVQSSYYLHENEGVIGA